MHRETKISDITSRDTALFDAWIDLGQTSFIIDWDQYSSPRMNPSKADTGQLYHELTGPVRLEVKYPDFDVVEENSSDGTILISLRSELENLSNGPPLPRGLYSLELKLVPRSRSKLLVELTDVWEKNKDIKQQRKTRSTTVA